MKQCLLLISFLMSSASSAKTTMGNPGVPDLFQAMAINSNRVELSWVDTSNNETHFEITIENATCYEDPDYPSRTSCDGIYNKVTLPADSTTYIDTQALANMQMKYQVRACKITECTPWNELFVTPPPGHHKVSGKIVDSNFNPIADVVVRIGSLYQTITDENGFYSFNDIPTLVYGMTAGKAGYIFPYRKLDLRRDATRQHFQATNWN